MDNFSTSYQVRLLALLVLDKNFYLEIGPLVDENYLSSYFARWLWGVIHKYYKEYNNSPNVAVLENECSLKPPDLLPEEEPLGEEFLSILRIGQMDDAEYIRNTALKFLASRQLRIALGERSDDIDEGNIDPIMESVRDLQQKLTKKRGVLEDTKVFSLLNLKEIYAAGAGLQTGINLIDQYVGGLFKKELTLIMADTNVGKSQLLIAMGGHIIRQGKRVLHITLEMSAARTLIRYFTTLIDPPWDLQYDNILKFHPEELVFNYVEDLNKRYEEFFGIEQLPTGKGTVEDIHRMCLLHQPDVLIVDYLDLLKPAVSREAKRFELGDITAHLRGLSMELAIPVVTATQASRQAARRRIVGSDLVAEDYEKIRISDVVVGMGQNGDDALKSEVIMLLSKSRNTEKGRAERYRMDFGRCRFHVLRQEITGGQEDE